ncbi:MAG: PaaI family thioesterase [Polaromonas sp.]
MSSGHHEPMADHQTTSSQLANTVVFAHVPFNRLLDLNREHAQDGSARVSLQMRPELTNYHNNTHGGVIMSMLDSAMASAAFSKSCFRQSVVTVRTTKVVTTRAIPFPLESLHFN